MLFAALLPASSRSEDTVHVAVGDNVRARTRLTGEVLDYTGETLLLRVPGGAERAFPAERVFLIETQRTADHEAGNKLLDQRQYAQALSRFSAALEKEPRRWVRREILAQMVWCHRGLEDVPSAVQYFMLLLQSDRTTPYFAAIPLAWAPVEPSPALAPLARQWLEREDEPVAVLLGASHLMSTDQRALALEKLRPLAFDRDPRVAWLARAQAWRGSQSTASDSAVERWLEEVDQAPEDLRAGGYYVVGRTLAHKQQPQRAALALMRVPILYPRERSLAGRALLEAGRELEKVGQKSEAVSLYQELIENYPQTPLAAEAQQRLGAGKAGSGQ